MYDPVSVIIESRNSDGEAGVSNVKKKIGRQGRRLGLKVLWRLSGNKSSASRTKKCNAGKEEDWA